MVKNLIIPVVAIATIVGAASCKKTSDCILIVEVTKDSIDFITEDTINVPVHSATVEVYSEVVGHDVELDLTNTTGPDGRVEFTYKSPAIYLIRITKGLQVVDAGYAVLKEGETVEKIVNLSDY